MADKGDNPDRDQARGSQMTTGRFAESAYSQAVDLLERSVSLLKESPLERNVSSPLEERQGQRALANYRRIYPGPPRTQAAGQSASGQTASGPTTSANRSLSSWWPSPAPVPSSSSGKKSTFRFQPYKLKETWTHEFCVVADKDQRQVPSTAMKQELREAGLGQRCIVFKNKKGDFKHIQEGLFSNFPKLREAGGFELYRQQEGKSLCYIKPPPSGYTIPFLKYTYGIKSAILYVLPIQRSLSMDPVILDEEEVDDVNIQTQECYQCGKAMPLRTLREHLKKCICIAEPVVAEPVVEVEVSECLAY